MPAGLVSAPHEEITYAIIGAAYDVHNRPGPGEREIIYQRAMENELHGKRLNFAAVDFHTRRSFVWVPDRLKNAR